MSREETCARINEDISKRFEETTTYFENVIQSEISPKSIASRLNEELPAKLIDLHRTLAAVLEDRFAVAVEQVAAKLPPTVRMRYHEQRIEKQLLEKCEMATWTPWHPVWSQYAQNTSTALFALSAGAALYTLFRSSSVFPRVLICILFCLLFGFAALNTEKFPGLLQKERDGAVGKVRHFLSHAQKAFAASAEHALQELYDYFANLGNSGKSK